LKKRQRPQSEKLVLSAPGGGQSGRMFTGGFFIALVCLCLGLLVVACGTNSGTTTGAGAAPTSTAVQQCGTVHTALTGIVTDTGSARTVEDCFARDYKQCQPATLNFDLLSLDSGVNRTFTIKSTNGQCTVTDAVQHYVVPKKPGPAQVYTCSGMTQEANGLHFTSCGQDGNIDVPATGTPVTP